MEAWSSAETEAERIWKNKLEKVKKMCEDQGPA